jgi:hypothetical protein
MVKTVVVLAVLVVGVMVAVKNDHILAKSGLTAVCTVAQTAADGTQIEACRPGKLQGMPDLSTNGCKNAGVNGTYTYWRCPAPVASQPNGR